MSHAQVLAVLFDGGTGNVFCAGQIVNGHVHLQTVERIKVRGIRLHITGKAETHWTESHTVRHGDSHETETEWYKGQEEYMNFELCLLGSRDHNSQIVLEPSVYKYPFSFILPAELPQSFEDHIGHIRYTAKAVVDRIMRLDDTTEVPFTVLHLLDLNREPWNLRDPMLIRREERAPGCCCVKGFTDINVTINRGCFVPGETMRTDGVIVNNTNTDIKSTAISIIQTIEYFASRTWGNGVSTNVFAGGRHTKYSSAAVARVDRPRLQRGQTDTWTNISLVVPQVMSSRLDGCGIINITHSVEILMNFDALLSKTNVCFPIVIGNIPLRDDLQPPPVVTSQPLGYPTPYNMAAGYMPPTNQLPPIGFNLPIS